MGAHSLYWRSLSVGAAAWSVPYCQYREVCSPTRPNAKQANELSTTTDPRSCAQVVYIAGDTLRHQPMGAGHMTVLQLHRPMAFRVLQWCHPMLASTTRTSCCTRMITLYGAGKWIQARARKLFYYKTWKIYWRLTSFTIWRVTTTITQTDTCAHYAEPRVKAINWTVNNFTQEPLKRPYHTRFGCKVMIIGWYCFI